jgi:hypothetical protein
VVAGVYRNLSVSAGYSRIESDGFRRNGDVRDQVFDVFAQAALTSRTSVQAEYRRRDHAQGDLQPAFFPESIVPNWRGHLQQDTFRLGARHAFAPGSVVLASAMYQKATGLDEDRAPDNGLLDWSSRSPRQAASGELQHLLTAGRFAVVSGLGWFRVVGRDTESSTYDLGPPDGVVTDTAVTRRRVRHGNAYLYAHLRPTQSLDLTLGASGDLMKSDAHGDRSQVSPKVGVAWSPFTGTTLRVAAFRVLKRTLITNQTLEPTSVAGFEQFFDDTNGTRSWRYGVGADQRVVRTVFAGAEASRRELEVPFELPSRGYLGRPGTRWREDVARGYLFWTPAAWIALRAEYAFERLDRTPANDTIGATLKVRRVDTHRVPLGVSFFHRSGLSASATATSVSQQGEFGENPPFTHGSDRFWLMDASVSWRLPRRAGTFGVVATNVLDTRFKLYENGGVNSISTVQPARAVFARVTLVAP